MVKREVGIAGWIGGYDMIVRLIDTSRHCQNSANSKVTCLEPGLRVETSTELHDECGGRLDWLLDYD